MIDRTPQLCESLSCRCLANCTHPRVPRSRFMTFLPVSIPRSHEAGSRVFWRRGACTFVCSVTRLTCYSCLSLCVISLEPLEFREGHALSIAATFASMNRFITRDSSLRVFSQSSPTVHDCPALWSDYYRTICKAAAPLPLGWPRTVPRRPAPVTCNYLT